MNLGAWLVEARGRLEGAGIASAALEAQVLAAHVLGVDRTFVLSHPEHEFPDLAGENLLQKREQGHPLAYILGYREFYGRRFVVNPHVLIPRQETETLIEAALEHFGKDELAVLDLGTGSGAIGVTLALERPSWNVTVTDVSEQALEMAKINAEILGAQVKAVWSDTFEELLGESFDLIVSNPPYIGHAESLPSEVREHEPHKALFSGDTGFEVYERLALEAADYLKDGGLLMMEVGHTQATAVERMFEAQGWNVVETRNDLSSIPRVVVVQPTFACAN